MSSEDDDLAAAAVAEYSNSGDESGGDFDEDETDRSMPVWLLPWEQIMCLLPLGDLASLLLAHSHFYKLAAPKRWRFWQLYFVRLSESAGYKKPLKQKYPEDMSLERIGLYWRRLILAESAKLAGNQLIAAGEYRAALAAYNRALAVRVLRTDKLTTQIAAKLLNNRAVACLLLHDYVRAAFDANHAASLQPKFAKAWYNKGRALANLWYHRAAREALKELQELSPNVAIDGALKICNKYKDRIDSQHAVFRRSPLPPVTDDDDDLRRPGRIFLPLPAAAQLQTSAGGTYSFHGEASEQNVWQFLDALQLRKVFKKVGGEQEVDNAKKLVGEQETDTEKKLVGEQETDTEKKLVGFALEPYDLQFEMNVFNQRQVFVRSPRNHIWDFAWRCSTKRARRLFTALKEMFDFFDNDPGKAAPVLVRKIWEHQPTTFRPDSYRWMLDRSVPKCRTDVQPFDFEILASSKGFNVAGSDDNDEQSPDQSTRINLLVEGDFDFAWCSPEEVDDDTSDDYDESGDDDDDDDDDDDKDKIKRSGDDDDDDDEENNKSEKVVDVDAVGKVVVEIEEEDSMEVALGRVLMKSLMAVRDDEGVLFPRYAVVTNGLDWWFVKIGSRLHVYGVAYRLQLSDFQASADSLDDKSPVIVALKGMMEWLHLIMAMANEDNSMMLDSDRRKLARTWFGI